ncbi:MAG: hypothetical protein ABRQ37_08740, partial [Candidatus Eremiobacterota bacterium]
EQREIYEARLKVLRDEDGALQTARIRGMEEGMKKGMEKGIEKGKIEVARKLFEKKFSLGEICEITGLSEDEIV